MERVASIRDQPGGFPRPLTSLVGRDDDLDRLLALLDPPGRHLVTLVGPGGVGKTRLALHLAATLVDEFGRKVCFVSLAAISDPQLVVPAIAQALGLPVAGGDDVEHALGTGIGEQNLVLLLDNAEHLLGAATLIARLVEQCPNLTAVVTSRAVLGVPGEQRLPLMPLSTPPAKETSPERLLASDAVTLFLNRALAIRPNQPLDDETLVTIADICRRLDGLPLAIELAASRLNVLSPKALSARLSNRLLVLGSNNQGVPNRLRTMREAIGWSHGLLSPAEQTVFRHLSVFPGGESLPGAERVCASLALSVNGLDALGTLVDHSLVHELPSHTDEPRFGMLETLREFGLERLASHDDLTTASATLATVCVDIAEEAEPHLQGTNQHTWFSRLDDEWDNMRAAITWAKDSGQPEITLRLFGAIWWFCSVRGHLTESRRLLETALAATAGERNLVRCRGLLAAGRLAQDQHAGETARILLTTASELADELDRPTELGRSLIGLAHDAHVRGEFGPAQLYLERAIAAATAANDKRTLASAYGTMGNGQYFQGHPSRARDWWEQARVIVATLGDLHAEAKIVGNLAAAAFANDDFEQAIALQEQALGIARQLSDPTATATSLLNLAECYRHVGQLDRAATAIAAGRDVLAGLGLPQQDAQALHMHASIALAQHDLDQAAPLARGAVERFAALHDTVNLAEGIVLVGELNLAAGRHADAAEALAMAEHVRQGAGIDIAPLQARQLADLRRSIRQHLPEAHFRSRETAARRRDAASAARRAMELTHLSGAAPVEVPCPPPAALALLTLRERQVLRLLVDGLSTRELADQLFISPRTATTHIANIFGKLEVNSRGQAVALVHQAERTGFRLDPPLT